MPRPHVIIIDDDPAARTSVAVLLQAFGFEVSTYESAEAFLAADDLPNHACLLLDVQLPGLSGRELQKKLKQDKSQLPIILISGYTEPTLVMEAMADGAIAVLEKPVDARSLVDNVERALQCETDSREEGNAA